MLEVRSYHEVHMQLINIQFERWLTGIQQEWGVQELPSLPEQKAIVDLIEEANGVVEIIASDEYQTILRKKQSLAGDVKIGIIGCVDGRRKRNFPLGFVVSSTEEPAGKIMVRESNGRMIPESTILTTALDRACSADFDLLQLVEAHTSLTTDDKCGAVALEKSAGLIAEEATLEDAGLEIVGKSLTVVTDHYNRHRIKDGLAPLATVGVLILYDTDTMGYILGYERRDNESGSLSTTDLTNRYQAAIREKLEHTISAFGSMRDTFMLVENVLPLAEKTLVIEKYLLQQNSNFLGEVNAYIDSHFPDLTDRQKQGLRYILVTTIAHQYLTGLSITVESAHPSHPFAKHNEKYMAISPDGKTFGGRHPGKQVFGTSPSNIQAARAALKIEIGIREQQLKARQQKLYHPIFVTVAVDKDQLAGDSAYGTLMHDDNETVQRAQARLINFMRGLYDDPELREKIISGEVLLIPGFIDQRTREFLRIPNIVQDV